jgi:hypothetical protein
LAPPEQLNINFIDPEVPNKSFIPIPLSYQPTNLSNSESIVMKSLTISGIVPKVELPPQMKLSMMPSAKDLQKAIKGLKPILNKDD